MGRRRGGGCVARFGRVSRFSFNPNICYDFCAASLVGRGSTVGFNFYDDPLPIRAWRQLLWSTRTFAAFPLAVLSGHLFPCVLCGDTCEEVSLDGNRKCCKYCTPGGDNVVYSVPNAPLVPENLAGPAMQAIPRRKGVSASDSRVCSGPSGESHWRAGRAANGSGKVSLDIHGLFALVCYHRCTLKLLAMLSPEACSEEHVFSLFLAAALGAHDALSDIVCMMLKHIRAQGERDFSGVLACLTAAAVDAPISISVADDGRFARFVFKIVQPDNAATDRQVQPSSEPSPSVNLMSDGDSDRSHDVSPAAESDGSCSDLTDDSYVGLMKPPACPKTAADFSMLSLVKRLLELVRRAGPGGLEIRCAIALLHQIAHHCRLFLGCTATPSVGAGNEVSEWVFGRDYSPYASVARNMSATNWRLYWNLRGTLSNQRLSDEAPLELLKFGLRAIVLVKRCASQLRDRRADYLSQRGAAALSTSDVSLRCAARLRTETAAANASAPSRAKSDSATATLRAFKASAELRVLEGIRDDSSTIPGGLRDAFVRMNAAEAGFKALRSEANLLSKIEALRKTRDRLEKLRGDSRFDVDGIIKLRLLALRTRATELAVNTAELDRHRTEKSGKAVTAGDLKARSGILSAIRDLLESLRTLAPLSATDAVQSLQLPSVSDIRGPDDVPARVGHIVIVTGDVLYEQLITAYQSLQGAYGQLSIARRNLYTAPAVARSILARLAESLSALLLPEPDLVVGSGASGLFDGDDSSLFDFTTLCAAAPESKASVAAALAHHVYRGIAWWETQEKRFERVVEALTLVLRTSDEPSEIALVGDTKDRLHAFRYASDLVHGRVLPEEWAALATTGKKQPVPSEAPASADAASVMPAASVISLDDEDSDSDSDSELPDFGAGEDEDEPEGVPEEPEGEEEPAVEGDEDGDEDDERQAASVLRSLAASDDSGSAPEKARAAASDGMRDEEE